MMNLKNDNLILLVKEDVHQEKCVDWKDTRSANLIYITWER